MNFLDIIILIPILWFGYKGFTKGFIVEIASLASLLLGIYCGLHFSLIVAGYITKWFNYKSEYLPLISFALLFILVILIVHFIAKGLTNLLQKASLGFANRIAGAIIGAAKVLLVFGFIFFFTSRFDTDNVILTNNIKSNSLLYNPLKKTVNFLYPTTQKFISESLSKVEPKK